MHPAFSAVTTVLFDLDGTLVDSALDLGAAVNILRVDQGLEPLPLDVYRAVASGGARALLGLGLSVQADAPQFAAMQEAFLLHYERCLSERTVAFDGVEALIAHLRARSLKWGVVTNKAQRFTAPLTQAMPLFATAGTIVSGDTTAHAKPHPAPLLEAARQLNVDPAHCVYVGDDERDIVAGRAAGMLTVAATYGYLEPQTDWRAWGAHAAIDTPLGLLELLQ